MPGFDEYTSRAPAAAQTAAACAPGGERDGVAARRAAGASGALRILVVDDDADNRALMSRVLRALGHRPLTAASAEAGLEVAFGERPDLVLLDIVLPGIDGHQVMRLMKAAPELAGVAIVAVTALTTPGHPSRALAEGFDGYLQKPIDVGRLAEVIGEVEQ